MDLYTWVFLGGIVGAVLMDVTETYAAKVGITSGVKIALVGRWCLGLLKGQFVHSDIRATKPFAHEVSAGWAFHLLVGGGGVALIYPLYLHYTGLPLPHVHLLGGIIFGLATSLLPWFVLLPAFGWGLFGRHGPPGSNALLASVLSHMPYGLGVGTVITIGLKI